MIQVLPRRAFDGLNGHLIPGASTKVLRFKHTSKVREITYLPGRSRFADGALNLWRPSALRPSEGAFPFIERQIHHLFPNADERRHVVDVLAYHVQHPGTKIRHCIMIRGPQGSGKNTLVVGIMGPICGHHNVRVIGCGALTSRFDDELVNVQILAIDELMRRDGWDTANQIKPLLSEDRILSEAKKQPLRSSTTPRLVFILSNDEAPLPVEDGDRRYFIPAYGPPREEPEFYVALHTALESEVPAFFDALLKRDVSHFDPNAAPPITDSKAELQAAVRPPVERQLRVWIDDRFGPFAHDIVVPSDVSNQLELAGYGRVSEQVATRAFKALNAVSLGQLPPRVHPRGRPRCWAVRNIDHWLEAGPAAWGRHFLAPPPIESANDDVASALPGQPTATVVELASSVGGRAEAAKASFYSHDPQVTT